MTPTSKPRRSGATIPWAERRARGQYAPRVSLTPDDQETLERVREPGETDPEVLRRGLRALGIALKNRASRKSTAPAK